MTESTNTTTDGAFANTADNVICVSFDPENNAYAALTTLKELDRQDELTLQAAAVVVRDADGKLVVKDEVGANDWQGAASGGLIGLLIGIIGGPLGVLIGGTYGVLVGSLVDIDDVDHSESVLSQISGAVASGGTALLAQVTEPSYETVDDAMAELGGTVLRRHVADVEAEIAAAEKAQRKAKGEATKELVRSRTERDKEQVDAKLDQLKAKLPHRTAAGAVS